jgi:lipopolysaccharide assembly outer membrane protein LptD (OstA)
MPAALRRMLVQLTALAGIALATAAAAQSPEPKPKAEGLALDQTPVEITADALDYDAERQLYVASGNVELVQGSRNLKADHVAFNRITGRGVASGNVELVENGEVLRAQYVEFDVNTRGGMVRQGSIDSPAGQFRASGDEIVKTGENTYTFKGGVFTTCRCPDPDSRDPWRIRAREAELEVGGYGVVHDATLDILDVPVLWTPWLILPLRTERQTGFLLPEISGGSRRSFEVGVPFFWAARENVNVTLTPRYSLRRGFKQDVDVETLIGRESSADVFAAFAYDHEVQPDSTRDPFDRERWATIGDTELFIPGGARFRSDFRFVSDNDYPIDFQELRPVRAERWLESTASLARGFGASGRFGALGVARFADDMQSPDDLDRDGAVLNRLPQLSFAALPGAVAEAVPWLTPSLDVDYTAFQSRQSPHGDDAGGFLDTGPDGIFSPDERNFGVGNTDPNQDDITTSPGGTEGDGFFQEGEPLTDEGHRFHFYPKLGAPLSLARAFEVYPEVGWYQTVYSTRRENLEQRGLPTARVDLRTRLRRHYGSVSHTIEPTVGYAYVGPQSQSRNPLLSPGTAVPQQRIRDMDLDAVTRDPADRIARANKVTYGALQRLYGSGEGDELLAAELRVLSSYDLEEQDTGLVIFEGGLITPGFGATRGHVALDPENAGEISEGLFDWRYRHRDGHRLWLGYRFVRDIPDVFEDFGTGERFDNFTDIDRIDQVYADLRAQITQRWLAGYRVSYSFESELLIQNAGFVEYLSKCGCWSLGVELGWDRTSGLDYRILYQRLFDIGSNIGTSPLLDSLGGL